MKKSILSLLIWSFPFLLMAQRSDAVYSGSGRAQRDTGYKGIKWVEGLTWEKVKIKAKEEKMIPTEGSVCSFKILSKR